MRDVVYKVVFEIQNTIIPCWLEVISGLIDSKSKWVYKLSYPQTPEKISEISTQFKLKRYKSDGFNIILFSLPLWFIQNQLNHIQVHCYQFYQIVSVVAAAAPDVFYWNRNRDSGTWYVTIDLVNVFFSICILKRIKNSCFMGRTAVYIHVLSPGLLYLWFSATV